MVQTAYGTIKDVDVILFMVDAKEQQIGKADRILLDKIKESGKKTILLLNKIDLIQKEKLLELIDNYRKEYDFVAIIPISAIKENTNSIILEEIEKNLMTGPAYYNKEEYTDQTLRQLAEETIREKALKLLDDEIPHGLYIECEKMKKRKTSEKETIYDIECVLYCLRESHKGIIIGKNGTMLKRIGTYTRTDLENMLDTKVNLKLWVKVKNDWINQDSVIKKFKI